MLLRDVPFIRQHWYLLRCWEGSKVWGSQPGLISALTQLLFDTPCWVWRWHLTHWTGHWGLCPSRCPHNTPTSRGSLGEEGTWPWQWPWDKQHERASLTKKDTSKVYFLTAAHHSYSSLMTGHRHLRRVCSLHSCMSHSHTHSHPDVWC